MGETQAEQKGKAKTEEEEQPEESSEEEMSVMTPDRPEAKLPGRHLYWYISHQFSKRIKIALLMFFVL